MNFVAFGIHAKAAQILRYVTPLETIWPKWTGFDWVTDNCLLIFCDIKIGQIREREKLEYEVIGFALAMWGKTDLYQT